MKRLRGALAALIGLFVLCALIGLSALGWVVYQEARAGDELQTSDVIIVLGARVKPNGSLSNSLEYRMETALATYRAGYSEYFIVCGAQGGDEPTTEASAMRDYLLAKGVPSTHILLDESSVNTRQNIAHARRIMDEQGFESAIVVTNAYHVARVKALCADEGIDVLAAAAKMPRGFFIPWKMRVREAFSWINYFVRKVL